MSTQGIGALERGDRRTPQRETLSLLIEALELGPEQRADFEAAAARKSALSLERDRDTPWLHAVPPPHPLPLSLTSFVGREREVAEIVDLVREHRLVTLTGPGGIGKTRAVLDAARVLSDEFPSDVRFVELATLGDAGLVVDAMVASLNLGETRNRAPFDTLLAHLEQRRVVLVVDNCEHLVAEVARTVEPLLRACAQLKILATSREPLRVPGERVYRLPALPGPPLEACDGLTATQAAAFPSIRLFAERATSFDRSFALDDSRAPVIAEICALVEGIPLAIELAAARVTALSLPALAVNLRRHLTSLGGGARLAQSRQQTMRAAIDWSYDLLDDHERELFATLAIFAGGCTIDAAARVAFVDGDEDAAYVRVFDVLSSLVDKSLVVADVGGDVSRYRMLEPFRQYARERLVASGELALVSRRHAAAFLQAAEDFAQAARLRPARPRQLARRTGMVPHRAQRRCDGAAHRVESAHALERVCRAGRSALGARRTRSGRRADAARACGAPGTYRCDAQREPRRIRSGARGGDARAIAPAGARRRPRVRPDGG
jgi:predicted ATPase